MANSALLDKIYQLPDSIIVKLNNAIKTFQGSGRTKGLQRAKELVSNRQCTYQVLKRIKNFFDSYNPESDSKEEYQLNGGDLMKAFVNQTLKNDRDTIKINKKIKSSVGMENQYRQSHSKSFDKVNRMQTGSAQYESIKKGDLYSLLKEEIEKLSK